MQDDKTEKIAKRIKELSEKRENELLQKKTKRFEYPYNDKELCRVTLSNDFVVRIISNEAGKFVDIRKYFNGNPTRKGVRLNVTTMYDVFRLIKEDIDENGVQINIEEPRKKKKMATKKKAINFFFSYF